MIVVTGATGKLGNHVIKGLLEKVPAAQIVAAVRNVEKAKGLAAQGVQVRHMDYARPETLRPAFQGAEKLLLISSNEVGERFAQHQAVVDAAQAEGVKLVAYTSILRADTSTLALASEHLATEKYVRSSGLPFVFLRNGWYIENHTEALGPALQHGVILGAAGEGRFASALRADYAEAAVTVLLSEGHENKIYELASDEPFTLSQLAAEVMRAASRQVEYRNLTQKEYETALIGFGFPAPLATMLADADTGAARGELDNTARDLHRLINRPTGRLADAVKAAIQAEVAEARR